jgi:putative flippase GtrA
VAETDPTPAGSGRDESEEERLDRNLQELLGELRVALPGVQVLFAFLLVVPFNVGFDDLGRGQELLYLIALLASAAASVLLIAPSAQHRMTFRLQDKRHLVRVANRLMIVGLGALALAMTTAVMLVVSVVFGTPTAAAVGTGTGLAFLVLWYVVPLRRRAARQALRGGATPS